MPFFVKFVRCNSSTSEAKLFHTLHNTRADGGVTVQLRQQEQQPVRPQNAHHLRREQGHECTLQVQYKLKFVCWLIGF